MTRDIAGRRVKHGLWRRTGFELCRAREVCAVQQLERLPLSCIEMPRHGNGPSEVAFVHRDVTADVEAHKFPSLHRAIEFAVIRERFKECCRHRKRAGSHPRAQRRAIRPCMETTSDDCALDFALRLPGRDHRNSGPKTCRRARGGAMHQRDFAGALRGPDCINDRKCVLEIDRGPTLAQSAPTRGDTDSRSK